MAIVKNLKLTTPPVRDSDRHRVMLWAVALAIYAFIIAQVAGFYNLTGYYLVAQDRWLLLCGALIVVTASLRWRTSEIVLSLPTWAIWGAVAALIGVCFAGHHWLLVGYDLSRDEQMASFDAAIFAKGLLVEPLPRFWQSDAEALNTLFLYPATERAAWVSSYLPMNAALRAVVGLIATPTLTGPIMTAIGALALWSSIRKIWPDHVEAPVIGLVLYLGSGQIIAMGMTAYAMPAHLAFNLLWLRLFLERRWWSDGLALITAFIAVGLHQPIFHPLFAGPIIFLVLLEKDWPRAASYFFGYLAIGLFWLAWPNWMWALVQTNPDALQPTGVNLTSRLVNAVMARDPMGLVNMMNNMLRFVAWQHVLLIPLLAIGWRLWRKSPLGLALAAGPLITLVMMMVILPYQGHGFGYRYLHGLIGNCILLAIFGWVALAEKIGPWRGFFLRASVGVFLILMPLQMWMAHSFYAPYAKASAELRAIDADYAVVDSTKGPFLADLVINPAALDERPVRLLAETLSPTQIADLCRNGASAGVISEPALRAILALFNLPADHAITRNKAATEAFRRGGCIVNRKRSSVPTLRG